MGTFWNKRRLFYLQEHTVIVCLFWKAESRNKPGEQEGRVSDG